MSTSGNVECVQINLSPLGLHMWADQHFDNYQDHRRRESCSLVPHLLLCRVIELELKAWHAQQTKSPAIKDTFGHDLLGSYRALPAKYRILSPDEGRLLTRVSKAYSSTDFAHVGVAHPEKGCQPRFELVRLEALARKLMEHEKQLDLAQG